MGDAGATARVQLLFRRLCPTMSLFETRVFVLYSTQRVTQGFPFYLNFPGNIVYSTANVCRCTVVLLLGISPANKMHVLSQRQISFTNYRSEVQQLYMRDLSLTRY